MKESRNTFASFGYRHLTPIQSEAIEILAAQAQRVVDGLDGPIQDLSDHFEKLGKEALPKFRDAFGLTEDDLRCADGG